MGHAYRVALVAVLVLGPSAAVAGVTLTNVVASGNTGDGVLVDSAGAVTLIDCDIHNNGAAGVRAMRAESGLEIARGPAGAARVHDNAGDGIVFGDLLSQSGKIVGRVHLVQIFNNTVGFRAQQTNATTASTTTTLWGNIIHDNRDSGIRFSTSYLLHRFYRGFGSPIDSNKVFHNAIGPTCSAAQTAAQIVFDGPVAVTPEEQAMCDAANAASDPEQSETACEASGYAGWPCYWTGSTCMPVWDLSVGDCDDNTANPNQIHSYNTNTDPVGSSEYSVGLYAMNGASVWADNNSWRTGDEAQNVDQDASSFVDADTICPAGGILLQCSDQ